VQTIEKTQTYLAPLPHRPRRRARGPGTGRRRRLRRTRSSRGRRRMRRSRGSRRARRACEQDLVRFLRVRAAVVDVCVREAC